MHHLLDKITRFDIHDGSSDGAVMIFNGFARDEAPQCPFFRISSCMAISCVTLVASNDQYRFRYCSYGVSFIFSAIFVLCCTAVAQPGRYEFMLRRSLAFLDYPGSQPGNAYARCCWRRCCYLLFHVVAVVKLCSSVTGDGWRILSR